jgi:hypothetical protein
MTRRVLALTCAAVLIFGTGFGHAPAAEPVVDTSELGDLGMLVTPQVIDATSPVLSEAGLDPARASILITYLDPENFEYAIRVTLDPTRDVKQAPVLATCRGCMTDQLVEAAVEAVKKAIERAVPSESSDREPVAEAEPETTPPETMDPEPSPATSRARPLGPLGWSGVAALSVGVAGAATGGAFLGVGETRPTDDMSQIRNFRPSGYALVGVGAALVITGVALLVVDRTRAKRQAPGPSAAVSPMLGRDRAGLAIRGRF